MEKNDILEVTVRDVAFGGKGVAELPDGRVCFIPFAVTGDKLEIELTKIQKKFCEGKILNILEPSADRVEPKCAHYGDCGGCNYQHISYEKQLEIKANQFDNALKRIAKIEELPAIDAVIASPKEYAYRNKITFSPYRNNNMDVEYGFVGQDNRSIIPISNCEIATEAIQAKIPTVKRTPWAQQNANREKPRQATMRKDANDVTIYYGTAPKGMPWCTEDFNGKDMRVPLGSFHQVNEVVSPLLSDLVTTWINDLDVSMVVDAFCGSGFLSLGTDKRVIGIEQDESGATAAQHNAVEFGKEKTHTYKQGNANKMITRYLNGKTDKVLILDPPRAGFGAKTLEAIARFTPDHILYVSCDPSTLARDLKGILEVGYEIDKRAILDMFPQTFHFESAVLLKKTK